MKADEATVGFRDAFLFLKGSGLVLKALGLGVVLRFKSPSFRVTELETKACRGWDSATYEPLYTSTPQCRNANPKPQIRTTSPMSSRLKTRQVRTISEVTDLVGTIISKVTSL